MLLLKTSFKAPINIQSQPHRWQDMATEKVPKLLEDVPLAMEYTVWFTNDEKSCLFNTQYTSKAVIFSCQYS